jgi:hypothetical protein
MAVPEVTHRADNFEAEFAGKLLSAMPCNRPRFELFEDDVYATCGNGFLMDGVRSEAHRSRAILSPTILRGWRSASVPSSG